MKISFAEPAMPKSGTLVVAAREGRALTPFAATLDKSTGGALRRAMEASRFKGGKDDILEVLAPAGSKLARIVLVGLGKVGEFDAGRAEILGGKLCSSLNAGGVKAAAIVLDGLDRAELSLAQAAAHLGIGARLRAYRFDKYRTKEKAASKATLTALNVMVKGAPRARKAFVPLAAIAEGIFLTRDVVSEPANVLTPITFAKAAKGLEKLGVGVDVLTETAMKRLGMGALLGVGQGSANPPRLVVMQWRGGGQDAKPIAFVGKGVTFDTGGISIKPAGGMEDMKWDMGGAGVVLGLMKALAGRKAKVNVVGICALAENMPSSTAQRPGDIVTTMSGQTVEVINTDAEGRLVLADALWYCQDKFKPRLMVDLATLTGAIIVALGSEYAGLFSNNDQLAKRLTEAGEAVGEKLWRLPLAEAYDKQINSPAADMKNIGGREGGSITAAQFLQRFVNKTHWAHLDIAAVTWSKKDLPTSPKGSTAFGVRLLDNFVAAHYEK
ncbi:MAG: leucyl aminopeptidase [Alphaproteobacteria bacterium]